MSEEKQKLVEVKLDKKHTHAGKDYPAGSKIHVTEAERDWLAGAKVITVASPKDASK